MYKQIIQSCVVTFVLDSLILCLQVKHEFNKNDQIFPILKMHEIDKTKLSDQTKFRLYEVKKN